jgi:hypothetical protein
MDIDVSSSVVKPDEHTDGNGNARTWKFFVDKINTIWRRGAGDFICCGQYLIEAKDELQSDAYRAMLKKLNFDPSVAKKLSCIAKNATLGAHVHQLPPCWSTLYELTKLSDDVLKAKLGEGTIHSGMQRKEAVALRRSEQQSQTRTTANNNKSEIAAAWKTASGDQRRGFLDQLGRDGLCAAMSAELQADLRDHVIGVTIAGASKSAPFAVYATNMLHSAMRCAEQPGDPEGLKHMAAALACIAKKAKAKGITRSDIVIAEGKVKSKSRN